MSCQGFVVNIVHMKVESPRISELSGRYIQGGPPLLVVSGVITSTRRVLTPVIRPFQIQPDFF